MTEIPDGQPTSTEEEDNNIHPQRVTNNDSILWLIDNPNFSNSSSEGLSSNETSNESEIPRIPSTTSISEGIRNNDSPIREDQFRPLYFPTNPPSGDSNSFSNLSCFGKHIWRNIPYGRRSLYSFLDKLNALLSRISQGTPTFTAKLTKWCSEAFIVVRRGTSKIYERNPPFLGSMLFAAITAIMTTGDVTWKRFIYASVTWAVTSSFRLGAMFKTFMDMIKETNRSEALERTADALYTDLVVTFSGLVIPCAMTYYQKPQGSAYKPLVIIMFIITCLPSLLTFIAVYVHSAGVGTNEEAGEMNDMV